MLTPTRTRRRPASRSAAARAPWLMNPIRMLSARSLGRRNSRGRGLPGCARAVTVPISTKPKPNAPSASYASASLSNPAARPSGLGRSSPSARTRRAGSRGPSTRRIRNSAPGTAFRRRRPRKLRRCTVSAGRRRRMRAKISRYIGSDTSSDLPGRGAWQPWPEKASEPALLVSVRPPAGTPRSPQGLRTAPYQRPVAHLKHLGGFGQGYYGRLARREGFDEALLVGPGGVVSEGAITNLGCYDGTSVVWPAAPALDGITMLLLERE